MEVIERRATEVSDPESFAREVVAPCRPVAIRGLVENWPAVRAARRSAADALDHVRGFVTPGIVEMFAAPRDDDGRFFYDDAGCTGFNFERRKVTTEGMLDDVLVAAENGGIVYSGSVRIREYLADFACENPAPPVPPQADPRIWIGTRSTVSTHYDAMDNLACVVAGRRRFTLHPPEAIGDLYVGPIDRTMAGQPVSLAASADDDARFPRFAARRGSALRVELDAGDALYMPKLWWHQVEGLAPVNILVNYWWDAFAAGPDAPYAAMMLAMIAIAERPGAEREAWRAFFDHYVFRSDGHPLAHMAPEDHGILGPLGMGNYGRIRASVMRMLRG